MNMIKRVFLLLCIVVAAFSLPADASRPYSPKSKKVKAAMKSAMNSISVEAARAHIGSSPPTVYRDVRPERTARALPPHTSNRCSGSTAYVL